MKNISISLSHSLSRKYNKADYSDIEILAGILGNEDVIIRHIYKKYFIKIKQMVFTFKNTILNPEDVFQEGLTRVVINIRESRFRGESSFYTYLNSICRNICLKELSKIKGKTVEINENIPEENSIDFEIIHQVLKVREQLNEPCRAVIDLRFDLKEPESESEEPLKPTACKSFEEIAEILGLTTVNARQRFKRCLDKLREYVLNETELYEYVKP